MDVFDQRQIGDPGQPDGQRMVVVHDQGPTAVARLGTAYRGLGTATPLYADLFG